MTLCSHLPLSVGGICDLLLFNGIWQKGWMDRIAWMWLYKITILCCEEILLPLLVLKKQAAMLFATHEGSHMARNWVQPLASRQWDTEASVQRSTRNCMLPIIPGTRKQILPHLTLRWEYSLDHHLVCSLAEHPAKLCSHSWRKESVTW